MRTPAVGFHNTPFGAASGSSAFKGGALKEFQNGVFAIRIHTFPSENSGSFYTIGVRGLLFCGFHELNRASIARTAYRFR